TGRYDAVSTTLEDGHWTSQLMIGVFFFLTAVLMMNVVIALMNGVYAEAREKGRRIWLRNRLELISSAENMSYFIPNFRQKSDFSPQNIYYTAKDQAISNYRTKHNLDLKTLKFCFSGKTTGHQTDNGKMDKAKAIQDILEKNQIETKRLIEEIKEQHEKENRELKEQHEKENRELNFYMFLLAQGHSHLIVRVSEYRTSIVCCRCSAVGKFEGRSIKCDHYNGERDRNHNCTHNMARATLLLIQRQSWPAELPQEVGAQSPSTGFKDLCS
ncbi:hypothetical protein BGZ76_002394, partial [Entomortierella beljakovae]